jgi:hypothetical protein
MSTNNIENILKNPEQIKQMIQMLSGLLETIDNNTEKQISIDEVAESHPKQKQTGTRKNKYQKEKRENKFLSMPEANMHKEDPLIAEKLYKQSPIARTRKSQTIKVKCRICGKEEEVRASLIYGGVERFKCNRCSTTPG